MSKLEISSQALQWIQRKVKKQNDALRSLPDNEAKKEARVIKHWAAIEKKVSAPSLKAAANGMVPIDLTRTELKSIHGLALETMVTIVSKVLPEYRERIDKIPDRADFYQGYVTRAEALYKGLADLLDVINRLTA